MELLQALALATVVLLVIGIDELARKRYRRALVWISLGLFFAALSMALLMSWNRVMLRVWEMHNSQAPASGPSTAAAR